MKIVKQNSLFAFGPCNELAGAVLYSHGMKPEPLPGSKASRQSSCHPGTSNVRMQQAQKRLSRRSFSLCRSKSDGTSTREDRSKSDGLLPQFGGDLVFGIRCTLSSGMVTHTIELGPSTAASPFAGDKTTASSGLSRNMVKTDEDAAESRGISSGGDEPADSAETELEVNPATAGSLLRTVVNYWARHSASVSLSDGAIELLLSGILW